MIASEDGQWPARRIGIKLIKRKRWSSINQLIWWQFVVERINPYAEGTGRKTMLIRFTYVAQSFANP